MVTGEVRGEEQVSGRLDYLTTVFSFLLEIRSGGACIFLSLGPSTFIRVSLYGFLYQPTSTRVSATRG